MIALVCAIGTLAPTTAMNIDDLRWMSGSWKCEIWGGTFEEVWLPPSGGTMQGVGRHLSDGKTGFMEFMSIEPTSDGGLTMWMVLGPPSKGDKKPVPFMATKVDTKESVWENPANSSPTAIHYSRGDGESMVCTLKSIGKPDEVFRFVRSK